MDSTNIYKEFNFELKKIITGNNICDWEVFDKNVFIILQKHGVKFEYGFIPVIYSLVDSYCDAYNHQFKDVIDGYSINQAYEDIQTIITMIENNAINDLDKSENLYNRLKSIS